MKCISCLTLLALIASAAPAAVPTLFNTEPATNGPMPVAEVIAKSTLPPGFTVDEELSQLGQALKLPPWEEPHRAEIEAGLPRVVHR